MQLRVLGSNSSGNGYLLTNGEVAVAIECGISFMQVKIALDFNIKFIKGCLLTHAHSDHAKYVKQFMDAGITVYASPDTIAHTKIKHHNWHAVLPNKEYFIEGFGHFKPFDVKHDVRNYAYQIRTLDDNTFAFITDSWYIPYQLRGLNNLIVEANYCDEIMDESGTKVFLRDRTRTAHLSLDTLKDFLRLTDLTKLNNIVLIHLSDKNSDATYFQKEISLLTGKNVIIAKPGVCIEFNSKPF